VQKRAKNVQNPYETRAKNVQKIGKFVACKNSIAEVAEDAFVLTINQQ